MSVSFYPVDGAARLLPRRRVERACPACAGNYCQPGWCEDGVEVDLVATWPECNFADGNALPLLRALGLPRQPGGHLEPEEVSPILGRIRVALGTDVEGLVMRAPLLREPEGANGVFICGSDDASARRRLTELAAVFAWAAERDYGVSWG